MMTDTVSQRTARNQAHHNETKTHLEKGLGRSISSTSEYNTHLNNVYNALIAPHHKVYTDPLSGHSLYLGNQTTAGWDPVFPDMTEEVVCKIRSGVVEKLIALKKIGVIAIVCCADNVAVFPQELEYLQLPMENNENCIILPYVTKAFEFINQKLTQGSVFIHCNAGVTRSASTVLYFLMKTFGWGYDQAHKYLFQIRPCIDTELFRPQLEVTNP